MKFVKLLPAAFAVTVLAACSTVSNVASSTVDAVGSAGSAVVDGAKSAGGAVVNGAKTAGNVVVDGAKSAGSAVVDGAKATGTAVSNGATAVKNTVMGTDSVKVAYSCSVNGKKQALTTVYTFENEKVSTATVTLVKKVLAKNLKVDSTYSDGTQFTDGTNVWTLSTNLTPSNVKTAVPVMFYTKGKVSDEIIAKDCNVVVAN